MQVHTEQVQHLHPPPRTARPNTKQPTHNTHMPASTTKHEIKAVKSTDRAHALLTEYTDELNLPNRISQAAIEIFNKAYCQRTPIRGLDIAVAASIRIACENHTIPRSAAEIAALTDGSTTKLLAEKRTITQITAFNSQTIPAIEFLNRYTADLQIPPATQDHATEILDGINDSRSPPIAAAGALWAAVQKDRDVEVTQTTIASQVPCSTAPLRDIAQKTFLW